MVKDTKYIIKRIIIGVGVALILMLINRGLVMDVEAQSPFTIRFYGSNDNLCATINESYNVTYSGTGTCATIKKINIANSTYNLQKNVKYNLYTSIDLDISRPTCNKNNLHIRSDSYIGDYNRDDSKWIGPTTVTWNNASHITSGINGSCRYDWGYVQQFTSNMNSSGMSFDFYFENNYFAPLHRISITRFELEVVTSGGSDTSSVVNSINNQTNATINNNNQNTQNIINNNNQNTQNIINNQNDNTQKQIDSNITCSSLNAKENGQLNGYLSSDGTFQQSNDFKTTRYIPINDFSKIIVLEPITQSYAYLCFYNGSPDNLISCTNTAINHTNDIVNVPQGATEVRFSLPIYQNDNFKANFKICRSSNLALSDSLSDDDISTASNDFDSFFRNINPNTHGLSDIVTAPLRLVSALTSQTCSPLHIPLPFVDSDVVLPCMVPIYQQYFGQWFNIYQLITTGVIAYWVCINFFRIIKNILDPTDDKVEVYDL